MFEDDPEIETSPFSGNVTRDGITVRVGIYRIAGGNEGWSLEMVDTANNSVVWETLFASDQLACAAFYEALEAEGIHALVNSPPGDGVPQSMLLH